MSTRPTLFILCAWLLGGCALVYNYDDYEGAGGQGGAGGATTAASGGGVVTSTATGTNGTTSGTTSSGGLACVVASDCASGYCSVDGVCCATDCSLACQECASSMGTTCKPVAKDTQTAKCQGTMTCNGSGLCLKQLGLACSSPGECASGFCEPGVAVTICCDRDCSVDPCHRCNVSGVCAPVPDGISDLRCMIAGGGTACVQNGSDKCRCSGGECLLLAGAMCAVNGDCQSNNCVSNVCM